MNKIIKKLLCFGIVLTMLLGSLSVQALAADSQALPVNSYALAGDSQALAADSYNPAGALYDQAENYSLSSSAITKDSPTADIVASMTLDQKISQMIIPAIRTWTDDPASTGTNVTNLKDMPQLAEALRKHQYGGIILYASNVSGSEQVTRLISDLQINNADQSTKPALNIPYFMPVDEEGGIVLRLGSGTRMTGNMAIGATGSAAEDNALKTGQVIGNELAAAGFNINFAPDADVNNNPANPVIGTRSFSDDPDTVAKLAEAYTKGMAESNIIATYKHFPGHGDTGTDSHLDLASVNKTLEELEKNEFVPFRSAIKNGADMIMTAHITYPKVDDEVKFAEGGKGYFPATMSKKLMNDILREAMGFNGIIVTDALEMAAIDNPSGGIRLVPGEPGSVEYRVNIAEKVINAGVDILLLPKDLVNPESAQFYDDYINAIAEKVEAGSIPLARINESVSRIIDLKKKYGVFDTDVTGANVEAAVENAKAVIGSAEHHAVEMAIARQAVTMVKNEDLTLPFTGYDKNIVILARNSSDGPTLVRAIQELQDRGVLDKNAYTDNLISGTSSGDKDSKTHITLDYYYTSTSKANYTDACKDAVSNADIVIALSKNFGISGLQDDNTQYFGIKQVMDDVHAAGGKFVLLSDNLPYDAARFQKSDAIILAYMGSGLDADPTSRKEINATVGAYNANVQAALDSVFDDNQPTGTLPVVIPSIFKTYEGQMVFSAETLYERGFGLNYEYAFTEGKDSVFDEKDKKDLVFMTNARADLLSKVQVDGADVPSDKYTADFPYTTLTLSSSYLETLAEGGHTLTAIYNYEGGEVKTETGFSVKKIVPPVPVDDDSISLNKRSATVAAKKSVQLKAVVKSADAAKGKNITWKSSNNSVAKVDKNGKVTGLKYGTAVITATCAADKKLTASCKVKVLFSDVTKKSVSGTTFKAVNWTADNGLVKKSASYGVNKIMTRAQFIGLLYKYAGKPAVKSSFKNPFSDVSKKDANYKAILWAASKGLITGFKDGTFRPGNAVTKRSIANILWKYAGKPSVKNASKPFKDVKKSKSVAWGKKVGIFGGDSFKLAQKCSRGKCAIFLYKYSGT